MKFFPFLLLILLSFPVFSQDHIKSIIAIRIKTPPKIAGILDDDAWKNAPSATDFVQLQPVAGEHEKQEERAEVK